MNSKSKLFLIIITGHPGSGKTTLAKKLEEILKLPLIYKDRIKEILYDTLGWSNLEWSRKLGLASYELLYYIVETHLSNGNSVIIESNFDPNFTNRRISKLKSKYKCKLVQIYCDAKPEVLLMRYSKRMETTERHPGHFDNEIIDIYKKRLDLLPQIKLNIETTIIYDTNTFTNFKENKIIEKIVQSVN